MRAALIPLLLLAATALAKPPPGTDLNSPEHAWFNGAKTPGCVSCCGEGDGHFVQVRPDPAAGLKWDVLLFGQWVPMEKDKRATRCDSSRYGDFAPVGDYTTEPEGRAVIWTSPADPTIIYCFSPPGWMS